MVEVKDWIRHRSACRIYCSASAEYSPLPPVFYLKISVLLPLFGISLSEAPPGYIYILRCSNPCWDLNHRYSRRKSRNVFVVSGLAVGFGLDSRFRCFPFPPHLNQWMCLFKPRNGKFFNVLQWNFLILFRFRCLNFCVYSAALCLPHILLRLGRAAPLPDRILFGDISVPCSTHICEKPLQLQTSLHCAVFFVYSAALCLPHIL